MMRKLIVPDFLDPHELETARTICNERRDLIAHTWEPEQNAMVGYRGEDPGDMIDVSAGTPVAFSSFLLHRSGANTTNRPRRSYFIAFTPELFTHSDSTKGVYNI